MQRRKSFAELSNKYFVLLIITSSLGVWDRKITWFPIFGFVLLLIASVWMSAGIIHGHKTRRAFLQVRNLTDILAFAAVLYALLSVIGSLFRNPQEGAIDIAADTQTLAFAFLYFLLSSGIRFQPLYFDLLLYCGLLSAGIFLFPYFAGVETAGMAGSLFADSGAAASFFLLFCMVSAYQYCFCKDKMRSCFYLMVSAVGFLALLLNCNRISLWLMAAFFAAVPVFLRPTASLVKRDMQLFFLYAFLLCNMGLVTEYADVIQKQLPYSLENGVYLELLPVLAGLFFFHYWEKIPQGVDSDRLVMRRMRRGYRLIAIAAVVLFAGMILSGEKWGLMADTMPDRMWKRLACALAAEARDGTGGFFTCFVNLGAASGVFAVIFCLFLFERMRRQFCFDRPVTAILSLISGFFLVQLFFFAPSSGTLTLYFVLLVLAAFSKEERIRVTSIKLKQETLLARYGVPGTTETE